MLPPSVVLNTPPPRGSEISRLPVKPSPVPAYKIFGLDGSMTMVVTAMLDIKSVRMFHEAPPSVDFQMPPVTLPAHMIFVSVGWIMMERTRPPMLPGPIHVQPALVIACGLFPCWARISLICWAAVNKPSAGILPFSSRQAKARYSRASSGWSASFSSVSTCCTFEDNAWVT